MPERWPKGVLPYDDEQDFPTPEILAQILLAGWDEKDTYLETDNAAYGLGGGRVDDI